MADEAGMPGMARLSTRTKRDLAPGTPLGASLYLLPSPEKTERYASHVDEDEGDECSRIHPVYELQCPEPQQQRSQGRG